jgi:glycosyltransferase involved in cell wall biosynthesis
MLEILLVYYEPLPAGQTTHVLSLARGLDKQKFHLTVVLPVDLRRSVAAFKQAGVQAVPLPLHKMAWEPQAVAALAHLIRQKKADIVHVHSQEAGLVARLIARMAGARSVIYTPQTVDIRRARWHWLYVLIESALSRVTDVIISVNEADRKRMIRWGISPHKVVTIPNGIDLSAFETTVDVAGIRRALQVDENRPLVMQVGRLSAQKDPVSFVEGAAQVVQKHPEAQFALIGEGPLRDTVALRARATGLNGHVRLLGWHDRACRLMPAAQVVSLTSRWEGMPHTLLEAMAGSRPVVATNVNGCPEIVVDKVTGFLVPPGDRRAWAKCVNELLSDPAKAIAMGQQGRRQVEEKFSARQMIARVEELYLQTAETQRRPGSQLPRADSF